MNWTGGRLQRHSKANANPQLKAQRQHFARARVQLQSGRSVPAPLSFSIVHQPSVQEAFSGGRTGLVEHSQPHATTTSLEGRHNSPDNQQGKPIHNKRQRRIQPQDATTDDLIDSSNKRGISAEGRRRGDFDADEDKRSGSDTHAPPARNTLTAVKQSLLKRSDWMGLAAAKPLKINFALAEEMEKIGRRRKITLKDKKRLREFQMVPQVHHNTIKPFRGPLSREYTPAAEHGEASIRIGGNIHQTETTRGTINTHAASPAMPSSMSDESMLLDRYEAAAITNSPRQRAPKKVRDEVYIAEGDDLHQEDRSMNLISLENALDSTNFDQIRERSSSAVIQRHVSAISYNSPCLPSRMSGQHKSKATQDASSSMIRGRHLLQSDDSMPGTRTNSQNEGFQVQRGIEDIFMQENTRISGPERRMRNSKVAPLSRKSGASDVPRPTTPGGVRGTEPDAARPPLSVSSARFTLEHQVLLEEALEHRQVSSSVAEELKEILSPQRKSAFAKLVPLQKSFQSTTDNQTTAVSCQSQIKHLFDKGTDKGTDKVTHRKDQDTSRNRNNAVQKVDSILSAYQGAPETTIAPQTRLYGSDGMRPASRSPSIRERFSVAGHGQQQQTEGYLSRLVNPQHNAQSMGDENAAWMRYVFPKDFDRIQNGFEFAPASRDATRARSGSGTSYTSQFSVSPSHGTDQSMHVDINNDRSAASSARTFKTAANTTIFAPSQAPQVLELQHSTPTETDFLTQLSPMAGLLDERVADISVYNNAAKSERSYVRAPSHAVSSINRQYLSASVPLKRTADTAFAAEFNGRPHKSFSHDRSRFNVSTPLSIWAGEPQYMGGLRVESSPTTSVMSPPARAPMPSDAPMRRQAAYPISYTALTSLKRQKPSIDSPQNGSIIRKAGTPQAATERESLGSMVPQWAMTTTSMFPISNCERDTSRTQSSSSGRFLSPPAFQVNIHGNPSPSFALERSSNSDTQTAHSSCRVPLFRRPQNLAEGPDFGVSGMQRALGLWLPSSSLSDHVVEP